MTCASFDGWGAPIVFRAARCPLPHGSEEGTELTGAHAPGWLALEITCVRSINAALAERSIKGQGGWENATLRLDPKESTESQALQYTMADCCAFNSWCIPLMILD